MIAQSRFLGKWGRLIGFRTLGSAGERRATIVPSQKANKEDPTMITGNLVTESRVVAVSVDMHVWEEL